MSENTENFPVTEKDFFLKELREFIAEFDLDIEITGDPDTDRDNLSNKIFEIAEKDLPKALRMYQRVSENADRQEARVQSRNN